MVIPRVVLLLLKFVFGTPKIQSTELKKVNKLKCSSKDASVPLGKEKKAITSGKGGRDLGGKVGWGGGQ
jgi:hypothetical protein